MIAFQFKRLPVDLSKVDWVQYYGNTEFAFKQGQKGTKVGNSYHAYSQGLHGGLDLGSNAGGIPVFAGVNGVLDYSGNEHLFLPNRVDVLVGHFRIIYGHLVNPIALPASGQMVVTLDI